MRVTGTTIKVLHSFLATKGTAIWGLEIVRQTGLNTGTVYPILDRLEALGWVSAEWEPDNDRNGPRRRYYRLLSIAEGEAQEVVDRFAAKAKEKEELLASRKKAGAAGAAGK